MAQAVAATDEPVTNALEDELAEAAKRYNLSPSEVEQVRAELEATDEY